MTFLTSVLFLAWSAWSLTSSPIDQTAPTPCTGDARALDFWVGTWDVQNAAGAGGMKSTVETVANGCGVLERYIGRPGPNNNRYVGAGLHAFDPATGKWRQLWSDTRPAITEMIGTVVSGTVVYEWAVSENSKRVPKRYTLSPFEGGVRQLGERSNDDGKTWTIEFDLRYKKADFSRRTSSIVFASGVVLSPR